MTGVQTCALPIWAEADIQKTTDKFISEVDKAVAAKEQDIMAV